MSSRNKRIIILIYTKDCSDTEGYKNKTNLVAQKMAASEGLNARCINRTLILRGNVKLRRKISDEFVVSSIAWTVKMFL